MQALFYLLRVALRGGGGVEVQISSRRSLKKFNIWPSAVCDVCGAVLNEHFVLVLKLCTRNFKRELVSTLTTIHSGGDFD
jgi:hypothetical protein